MIRPATADDLSQLRHVRTWLSEPTHGLLEATLSGSGSGFVLVSTADGRPVGYVLTTLGADAYVAELVVEPAYRREGRATGLLRTALAAACEQGCGRVRLTIHEQNESARALYESLGFEVWKTEPDYYADGGTALVLGREC
ncbi:GNAT family N-acetyltransferase [Haladaptatus sp. NG-WS-4]